MDEIDAAAIEQYQKLFEQDPNSKVFAPLADAYRKMGLLKEGLDVAQKGVATHPNFAGGRVALGRLMLDSEDLAGAEKQFRKATELSPENILAHQLTAEICLKLKRTKEALKAFKMLLFLAPDNEKAKKAVSKLESLTADEYDDDIFAMKPLKQAVEEWDQLDIESENLNHAPQSKEIKKNRLLERVLSLADAYLVRNEIDKALEALNEAERLMGADPEIVKRLKIIHQRQLDSVPHPKSSSDILPPVLRAKSQVDQKIDFLQDLLQKIKTRDI